MRASESNLSTEALAQILDQIQDTLWRDGVETEWTVYTVIDIAVILRAWHLTTDNYQRGK